MGLNSALVDVIGAECGQAANGGKVGGPHPSPTVEAMPLPQLAELDGQIRGATELANLDADPDLHHSCVADGVWARREAELLAATRGLGALGLAGAGLTPPET